MSFVRVHLRIEWCPVIDHVVRFLDEFVDCDLGRTLACLPGAVADKKQTRCQDNQYPNFFEVGPRHRTRAERLDCLPASRDAGYFFFLFIPAMASICWVTY